MRECKQCNCSIEHKNKNSIFCSVKCRKKYSYKDEYRLGRIEYQKEYRESKKIINYENL